MPRVVPRLLLLVVVLVACAPMPAPTPPATPARQLSIENGTTLDSSLVVNGAEVARVNPKGGKFWIPNLPAPPWDVEARTTSGRLMLQLRVEPMTSSGPATAWPASTCAAGG